MPSLTFFDVGILQLGSSSLLDFVEAIIILQGVVTGHIVVLGVFRPPDQSSALVLAAGNGFHLDRDFQIFVVRGANQSDVEG